MARTTTVQTVLTFVRCQQNYLPLVTRHGIETEKSSQTNELNRYFCFRIAQH